MILQGLENDGYVLASMDHYDCRSDHEMLVDGGQPYTFQYAGYGRYSGGKHVWFKVPQRFAELYDDYRLNRGKRKFGLWKIEDVEILSDTSDIDFEKQRIENAIWGTRGKDGDQPLKYVHLVDCKTDHLENILTHYYDRISDDVKNVIKEILNERENERGSNQR